MTKYKICITLYFLSFWSSEVKNVLQKVCDIMMQQFKWFRSNELVVKNRCKIKINESCNQIWHLRNIIFYGGVPLSCSCSFLDVGSINFSFVAHFFIPEWAQTDGYLSNNCEIESANKLLKPIFYYFSVETVMPLTFVCKWSSLLLFWKWVFHEWVSLSW